MIKIGVLCPADIAIRRFLPALSKISDIKFIGMGVCNREERISADEYSEQDLRNIIQKQFDKASQCVMTYGGKVYDSYLNVLKDPDIDAVYIPLPPALHSYWTRIALENGKHVLIEKPSFLSSLEARELCRLADERKLTLYENYMFLLHSQLTEIEKIIKSGRIGDVRLYRMCFGFPHRGYLDFRYKKDLGGGALNDAGGYPICLARNFLGNSINIQSSHLEYDSVTGVDLYGAGTLINDKGVIAQIAFGMDNAYKCELEVWGSSGTLYSNRIFTAPDNFTPNVVLKRDEEETVKLECDDAFMKSILRFYECIYDDNLRKECIVKMLEQVALVEKFRELGDN